MLMCVTAPSYGAVLSRNVRVARAGAGISQAQVARRMVALGYRWTRQTVSEVEANDRRLLAEEVLGLSWVLGVPVHVLMLSSPPQLGNLVSFPAGYVFRLAPARATTAPGENPSGFWDGDAPAFTVEETEEAARRGEEEAGRA
jgi:transcriptional regulator with XRE-family HTH domain